MSFIQIGTPTPNDIDDKPHPPKQTRTSINDIRSNSRDNSVEEVRSRKISISFPKSPRRIEELSQKTLLPGQYIHDDIVLNKYSAPHIVLEVSKLNLTNNDILIVGYPQSGVDKVAEITFMIQSNCDTYVTKHQHLEERVPFLDFKRKELDSPCEIISEASSPRIARTHLPYRYLENHVKNDVKIIYVARKPQEVMVAYYHLYVKSHIYGNYSGGWDEFFQCIKNKSLIYGDWSDHIEPWLEHRSLENILIINYDDFVNNLEGIFIEVSNFLDKTLNSGQKLKAMKYVESVLTEEDIHSQNLDANWWKRHVTEEQEMYFEKAFRSIVDEIWNDKLFLVI